MKTNQAKRIKLSHALQPRLRMFLSVDLVGSTAFKQSQSNHIIPLNKHSELPQAGPAWFKSILSFYREFETILLVNWEEYHKTNNQLKLPKIEKPEFWKSVGDELLYTFDIIQPRQAVGIITIWISTLENYREILKKNTPSLDIKASAWIAGFPLMNSEVIFEQSAEPKNDEEALVSQFNLLNKWYKNQNKRDNLSKDYVGPAIDTGFRISTNASPRKLVISVDLALLLTGVTLETAVQDKLSFFFEGTQSFKGVVGGRPYPVLWISVHELEKIAVYEDKLAKRNPVSRDDLKAYCAEYIKYNSDYLIRPFIFECDDVYFSEMPNNYLQKLEHTENFFKNELRKAREQEKNIEDNNLSGLDLDTNEIGNFTNTIPIKKSRHEL